MLENSEINELKKFAYKIPNVNAGYSTRKLHSTTNHICTCKKPKGVKDGGYCYAQYKMGVYCKPCELGMTIQDVLNGADIIG
jgi:hypothetical protein